MSAVKNYEHLIKLLNINIMRIFCSAHVILIRFWDDTYYINNYIDWNTYNIIYDSDFFNQEMRAACDYEKQIKY